MKHGRRGFLGRAAATLAAVPLLAIGTETAKAEPMAPDTSAPNVTLGDDANDRLIVPEPVMVTYGELAYVPRAAMRDVYAEPGTIVMGSGTSITGGVVEGQITILNGASNIALTGCTIRPSSQGPQPSAMLKINPTWTGSLNVAGVSRLTAQSDGVGFYGGPPRERPTMSDLAKSIARWRESI